MQLVFVFRYALEHRSQFVSTKVIVSVDSDKKINRI